MIISNATSFYLKRRRFVNKLPTQVDDTKKVCREQRTLVPFEVEFKNPYLRILHHEVQMLLRGVPTHKDRYEADESRQDPRAAQHASDRPLSHDHRVLEGADDGVIPVHADAAQVKDRRGGEVNVQRVPHVAHEPTEQPLATGQLGRGVKRHRAHGHQEVGRRQAHHVTVCHHAQPSVPPHAGDHQGVAQNRGRDDAAHDDPLDHHHEHVHVLRQVLDGRVLHGNRGHVVRRGARRSAGVAGRRRGRVHSAGQACRHRCHYVQHGDHHVSNRLPGSTLLGHGRGVCLATLIMSAAVVRPFLTCFRRTLSQQLVVVYLYLYTSYRVCFTCVSYAFLRASFSTGKLKAPCLFSGINLALHF